MTFADLYHLDKKCRDIEETIASKDPFIDEEGYLHLLMSVQIYHDLKDVLSDCKALIYDLCQADVKDVISRDS